MSTNKLCHPKYGTHLTETTDCAGSPVTLFENETEVYAVYHSGEPKEHSSAVLKSALSNNPDAYLFTPFIEAIGLINHF